MPKRGKRKHSGIEISYSNKLVAMRIWWEDAPKSAKREDRIYGKKKVIDLSSSHAQRYAHVIFYVEYDWC